MPPIKKSGVVSTKSAFGGSDSESDSDSEAKQPYNKRKFQQTEIESQLEQDQYDEVYDSIKEAERAVRLNNSNGNQGSKYMAGLLEGKKRRELDRLKQAKERTEKERSMESDELKNKEVFVTASYQKFQSELDAKIDQLEKKEDTSGSGNFHLNLLNSASDRRQATLRAATTAITATTTETIDDTDSVLEQPESSLQGGLNIVKKKPIIAKDSRIQVQSASDEQRLESSTTLEDEKIKQSEFTKRLRDLITSKVTEEDLNAYKKRYFDRLANSKKHTRA
ncbi:hypothetical protein CANARDRAFT_30467 [[Candida] arabinofermentans NRRL YB-2248]|uniref:Nuclear speckle splicing regulatory protein 1 N-terminal domain-containing protein n=1 Tax=[Candida] arabinofermentans NRRL YB-2248 TaxID=983967 RepID=A0A1E4STS1_9ASCO|nr:hypothetical protein CANARDRAFT_30467 [[Candida] arabinofermentans NRRL YB-2248]